MGDVMTLRPPAPWYADQPNPPCLLSRCDRGHRVDEFAASSALCCTIQVAATEWYSVTVSGDQSTCWSTPGDVERHVDVCVHADVVPVDQVPSFARAVLRAAELAEREQKRLGL